MVDIEQRKNEELGNEIVTTLERFGRHVRLVSDFSNRAFTGFLLATEGDTRISSVVAMADELSSNLGLEGLRILNLGSKGPVMVEIPNKDRAVIPFRDLFSELEESDCELPVVLGIDTLGGERILNLAGCPNLLIAGQEGMGKTSLLDNIIWSIINIRTPEDAELMLVDSNRLGLSIYNDFPGVMGHCLYEQDEIIHGFQEIRKEIDRRVDLFAKNRIRRIGEYNKRFPDGKLPYIVVVLDEYQNLDIFRSSLFEEVIGKLGSIGGSCGIHMVMATSKVTADVITGFVKSNFRTQIAFKVPNCISSRIIMDDLGAERLVGPGDMLLHMDGLRNPIRVQCAYMDQEFKTVFMEYL